jgi:hypothetical protein
MRFAFRSMPVRAALVGAALIAAAACGGSDDPGLGPNATIVRTESADTLFLRASFSGLSDSGGYAVRTPDQWAGVWAKATRGQQPAAAAPTVDFSRNMVLLVAMGTRPSGGYTARIDRVYDADGTRVVEATFTSPQNCLTIAAITAPCAAVIAPTTAAPVRFVTKAEVRRCQ